MPDPSGNEPNLELPRLPGFGRKGKDAERHRNPPAPAEPATGHRAEESPEEAADGAAETPSEAAEPVEPEETSSPTPPRWPVIAAMVAGAAAGLIVVLLSFVADAGCDAARGTSSCGGGGGLLILIAVVAIGVVVGASLLRAWRLPDPGSTSFLGVGVTALITLIAFLDKVDSVWMLLLIPLLTALSFAAAWWATTRLVAAGQEQT